MSDPQVPVEVPVFQRQVDGERDDVVYDTQRGRKREESPIMPEGLGRYAEED